MKLVVSQHEKMKFSIRDFFSKCDQICRKLRIWLHLLKKSLMENFIFVLCLMQMLRPFSGVKYVNDPMLSLYRNQFSKILFFSKQVNPAGICLFQIKNKNAGTMCQICSTLKKKALGTTSKMELFHKIFPFLNLN